MPRARFISVNYSQKVLGMNRSLHQLRNRGFEVFGHFKVTTKKTIRS